MAYTKFKVKWKIVASGQPRRDAVGSPQVNVLSWVSAPVQQGITILSTTTPCNFPPVKLYPSLKPAQVAFQWSLSDDNTGTDWIMLN